MRALCAGLRRMVSDMFLRAGGCFAAICTALCACCDAALWLPMELVTSRTKLPVSRLRRALPPHACRSLTVLKKLDSRICAGVAAAA